MARLLSADSIEHDLAERALVAARLAPAPRRRPTVRSPSDGHDPATEGRGQGADRPPDRPQPDDADGHVAQLRALERLPRPLALQLEELREPARHAQDHHQHVLGDGPAEHAAGVGHDETALERRRGQRPLHPGRGRVDPGEVWRPGQQPIERVGRDPATEHDLDVVHRAVGEALDRHGHAPGARRRRPDALQVARSIAG
jgi:hypothetical protein